MRRAFALAMTMLLACAASAATPDRRIAMTIDDVPWQRAADVTSAQMAEGHAKLIQQLRAANVPVIGFVNEDKLELRGTLQPERLQMLQDWLDLGAQLGNHTYGHVSLHDVGVAAFEDAILKGERQLRPLLTKHGTQPQWFRHPYLRSGRTPEERDAVQAFLHDHGYRVAPVTVDNGEWVWAFAYARVQRGDVAAEDRDAQLRRLRDGYIPYMLDKLDFYERASQDLFGRLIPQVWLIHANELNADAYADLVTATQRRGYRFITLDEAMRDPAYAHEDGYRGKYGPSWIHRWAMAEKKPKTFYEGEPEVPDWVLELAGVESE